MILIAGCGPMGSAIHEALKDQEVSWVCDKEQPSPASGCTAYDIKNSSDIARVVKSVDPQQLILAEEISNLEYCEKNRLDAMEFNTRGIRFFVEASNPLRARVIYISSAYVFDGRKAGGLYTEFDHVNPINVFGETKLMGEVAVDKAADHLTLRMGELYGNYPDNFVSSVLSSLKYGQKIELARDMYFSPIFVDDVVEAIVKLTSEGMAGLYNLAGPERISQYEMGLKVAKVFGLDESLLVPLSADELGLTVRLPRDLSLDVSKISMIVKIRGIDDGLKAMKESMRE